MAVIVAVQLETPVTTADRLFVREGGQGTLEFATGATVATTEFEDDQVTVLFVAFKGLTVAVKVTV